MGESPPFPEEGAANTRGFLQQFVLAELGFAFPEYGKSEYCNEQGLIDD